uniref:Uncharacterized protein n=1 Tax=Meloidogyne enterolobii TaxID=390850 RepID=A0A6V7UDX7_MELEN|nr:unnamed protein product [Meloidogyne enterolobii]
MSINEISSGEMPNFEIHDFVMPHFTMLSGIMPNVELSIFEISSVSKYPILKCSPHFFVDILDFKNFFKIRWP